METPLFTRLVGEYLSHSEYAEFQVALAENPEIGPVIPGSGGVRKVRWSRQGRGKRGGVRVIYYVRDRKGLIWLLTIYDKREQETIPATVLRKIREELENE